MSDHAKLAPSSADRWMNCPGSIALEEMLPLKPGKAEENTPDQQLGIDAHSWCEQLLLDEVAVEDVPEDLRYGVVLYVEKVKELQAEMGSGTKLHIEKQLRHPHKLASVWGTADAVLISPDKKQLTVVDYKNGRIPVTAEGNWQLITYSALAAGHFKLKPTAVQIVIVQPNALDGLPPVRTVKFTGKELAVFEEKISTAAELALSAEGARIFNPGEKQCRWCPAAGQCVAQAEQGAVADFYLEVNPPGLLSDDRIAELLLNVDAVDTFISQLKKAAFERAMDGRILPGFKLVRSRTVRKWDDPATVEAALRQKRIPVKLFLEPGKLKSFTKLENIPRVCDIVAPHIVKPVGNLQLQPASDPRPEASPMDDFPEAGQKG